MWVVGRVCCAVAQHDFPECVLSLFLLDLLPLLSVKHLGSIFWQLLMGNEVSVLKMGLGLSSHRG